MEQATTIFVAGIFGVFAGMTLLYTAIRIISFLVDRFGTEEDAS